MAGLAAIAYSAVFSTVQPGTGAGFELEAIGGAIIGGVSAIIALVSTLLINMIINIILGNLVGVTTIATLNIPTAIAMILLSVGLNLIASLIPANIAAKKDPVAALRSE